MIYAILDANGDMLARYPGPELPTPEQAIACLEAALFFAPGTLLQVYPNLTIYATPLH